jgi:hypothetical protein
MRKFNVELNVSKLNTKKVQLAQIETRYLAAQNETERLRLQFETKAKEVYDLETAIKLAQATPPVS